MAPVWKDTSHRIKALPPPPPQFEKSSYAYAWYVCMRRWAVRWLRWMNLLPHKSQQYGLWSLCMRRWAVRLPSWVSALLVATDVTVVRYMTYVCVRRWVLRCLRWVNFLPHKSQMCGLWSVCVRRWRVRLPSSVYALPQVSQLYGLSAVIYTITVAYLCVRDGEQSDDCTEWTPYHSRHSYAVSDLCVLCMWRWAVRSLLWVNALR